MSSVRRTSPAVALTLVLLFVASDVIEATESTNSLFDTVVRVTNSLESRSSLQIHCKDKHHDLGTHTIPYSQTYQFKIPMSAFFGDTLYFCGFVWGNKLHWFDIYKKSRDLHKCFSKCRWVVKNAGPCVHVDHTDHSACFGWNKR